MLLCCCYTPAHEVLYREVFRPSVPEGFEVQTTLVDEAGPGDFLSPEFLRCVRRKVALVKESLRTHADEVVVWSDVDVRFVDLSPQCVGQELEKSGCEILFQCESPRLPDVNTGFFVCRASRAVRFFFDRVWCCLQEDPAINEQTAVNHLLMTLPAEEVPRWGYLPSSFFARTHGWPPPRRLVIYHANYTKGQDAVGQKLAQFAELEAITRGGLPAWIGSIIKRIPSKILSVARGET